jgi:hypothetical protein
VGVCNRQAERRRTCRPEPTHLCSGRRLLLLLRGRCRVGCLAASCASDSSIAARWRRQHEHRGTLADVVEQRRVRHGQAHTLRGERERCVKLTAAEVQPGVLTLLKGWWKQLLLLVWWWNVRRLIWRLRLRLARGLHNACTFGGSHVRGGGRWWWQRA